MKNAFSLIEVLIALGILSIVLFLALGTFGILTKRTDFEVSIDSIISTLNLAKNKTLASEQAFQYGVYFDNSVDPDKYVFFKGPNYVSRDVSFDEIHELPLRVEISSIDFNISNNYVVFNRLEGDTDNYGSVSVQSLASNEIRDIYIYSSGEISTQVESVSGAGLISDSRHVHFDLGWSISGADTLKFNFVNASQIEEIPMADYFDVSDFDWEGQFLVNGIFQEFRIHTHQLDPTTLLCIHRDRNQGKNTEEVYIYIVQGGIEKEIAHYDDDQYASVYKGIYVWNEMEKQ